DISKVYGLPGIHEYIKSQKSLRAVIVINASQGDMEIIDVKEILIGLIIAILLDSSKYSYHILYAIALLIDHHKLKAFTELFRKKGHIKQILQFSLNNEWNELNHTRVQPSTSLCLEQNSDKPEGVFKYDLSIANKIQQENKKFSQFSYKVKNPGFPKVFVIFTFWVKYNEPFIKTETYKKRYIKLLSNEGDIYVRLPWETYILENLAISDNNRKSASLICYLRKDLQGIVRALKTEFLELRIKKYHGKSDPMEKTQDFSNVKES
ncbi:7523_t:CDS:2, partial [Funneliformis geosporum]